MNVEKLYDMQKELDRHIEEKHGLDKENLFDRKLLALLVEIGELANETRCFKFWSIKPASDKKVILEEFVDGIHFILSLGIESDFKYIEEYNGQLPERTVSEQFLEVYGAINEFRVAKSEPTYGKLFSDYLDLARMLDFTGAEIEEAYIGKNEINYQRQRKGY